jgi:hypothetical protein
MGPEVPLFTVTFQRFFPTGSLSVETVTARMRPPLLPASLTPPIVTLVMLSRPTLTFRWADVKVCAEAGSLATAPAPREGGAAPEGRGPTHR